MHLKFFSPGRFFLSVGNPVEERDAKALAKALKRNKKFSIKSFLGMDDDAS